jgi:nucleoside-diphosphate-sugar epimerase
MRLLLTGSAGYAGKGLAQVLKANHFVRGFDLRDSGANVNESVVGDIADLDLCRRAVDGVDAVVHCHMAPNPDGYKAPPLAFDVNVKGTANLYHAAVEKKVLRAVLISSTGVVPKGPAVVPVPGEGPYNFAQDLYCLTKILQETIARVYFEKHRVVTSILRPPWIVWDGECITKYGQKLVNYDPTLIDPRDIGAAVHACLMLENPGLECFHIAQDDSGLDMRSTRARLKWSTVHKFAGMARAQ